MDMVRAYANLSSSFPMRIFLIAGRAHGGRYCRVRMDWRCG